ncbi:HAD-IB family hydrolase [Alkaliphilus sp. MSJ-5]|uniref:phosphoserine phosphatase n=1 Tax=Alkaliphilus flagellatus TaxID=2841507 RepID=A0ABS6G3T8_9FIRM|nr:MULTISPECIES: HAD-IB family hydrolase [Alkaliphilus]MBU5677142.1 HAD-IB family hydrolase [Alkaliphilus flagellatus]QUH20111.1 HAD-IB family hydrolase [Alkaliphilus sp. B6464]
MKNIGVFFDIDGTLYRDSLMVEHFKSLIKYEVIDPIIWHTLAKNAFHDWDMRQGNYDNYLNEVSQIYLKSMKGLNRNYMDFISNQVINLKGDRVYRFTRDRINWHKSQGHKVVFISGSPDYLVSKMAEKYGVADYRGTEYIVDENNNFTGEIIQMWDSDSKHTAIMEFVDKYNIDLDKSYAYGDTNGDFSMLKLVGSPIAINPARELLQNIRNDRELRKKATIIIERKDVIYKLTADVEFL